MVWSQKQATDSLTVAQAFFSECAHRIHIVRDHDPVVDVGELEYFWVVSCRQAEIKRGGKLERRLRAQRRVNDRVA